MKGKLKNHFMGAFALLAVVIAVAAAGGLWGSGAARSRWQRASRLTELRRRVFILSRAIPDLQLALASYLQTGDEIYSQRYGKTLAFLRSGLT
jgi:hypothetical protein